MLELNKYQVFYGTIVRGPKAVVDNFIKEQLQNVYSIEKKAIGNGEVLLRTNCGGRQVECQTDDYKELAIAIFSSLGAQGSLFVKKSGEASLEEYVLGEMDPDIEDLQFYNVCPDEKIHEKYILCNYGEEVEFKYEPSEYVISMVSDNEINKNAKTEPSVGFGPLEKYDEALNESECTLVTETDEKKFCMDGGTLLEYKGTAEKVIIPSSVKIIGIRAFCMNKKLQEVVIPATVECIEAYAFSNCPSLSSVVLENPFIEIGGYAFEYCKKLSKDNFIIFGNRLFEYLGKQEIVTVPQNVTDINKYAFCYQKKIKKVILPQSISSIGEAAFANCINLESINVPAGATVGARAFSECEALVKATDSFCAGDSFCRYVGTDEKVVINQGIKRIDEKAFKNNAFVKEIVLPEGLEVIGYEAFLGCKSLESVNIPSTVHTIESEAFFNSGIKCVELAEGIKNIEIWTFKNCTELEKIVLPESLETIGCEAFYRCESLTDITIPAGVKIVRPGAFAHCSNLENICILGKDTEVYPDAFVDCKATQDKEESQ